MPQDIRIILRSFVVLLVFILHLPTTIANPPDPHVLKCRTWILARPYEEAQHVCEDELAKSEQSDTLNTSTLLDLLHALTSIHSKAKNYGKAEASASRALRIATSILNPGDPLNAKYMLVLANVLQHQSRFLESEVLYRKALQLIQVDSSQKPHEMANILTNLAQLLLVQGRYDASVPLLRRALRLRTQVNDSTGDALYLLATVLQQQGLLAEAIPLFERAASVFRGKYGPMSVQVGLCTVGIAELLRLRGQLNEAEPVFLYALSILKRNATTPQLDLARAYTKLGLLYQTQGRYLLAQNLLQLGFSLRQENLGDSHWLVAESLHSIGINNLHLGQPQSSIPLLWRAISILDSALNFPLLETQATSLLEKQRDMENSLYSLLLKFPDVTELKRLAITVAILRKGRSEDAGRRSNRATLTDSKTQAQAVRLTKWKVARAERERLILQGAGLLSPAAYRTRFDELRHEIDELELAILSDQKQTKTGTFLQPRDVVSKVTSRVGSGSAYLEFVWTSLNQPRSHDTTAVSSDSRYLALVLDSSGKVGTYDLGDAAKIDRQVSVLLGRLQNRGLDPLPAARAVYESLLSPVMASLPSTGRIYVSAEGSLHLIPFAALHDGKNYLIDRYQFIYLNSGRDLLNDDRRVESGPPVVVADPEFAAAPPPSMDSRASQPSEKPADGAVDRGTASLYAMLTSVTRLPGTLREAVLLSGLWPDAKLLLGREAEETAVRQLVAPLFLHLATHGVFLEDQPPPPMATSAQSARALVPLPMMTGVNEPAGLAEAGDSNLLALAESDRTSALNRSALLLAGAESAPRSRDRYHDGLLTADEVREMNLWGTKLVVLSACDSGRGAIRVGQGVYGLRRAFFAAGAETLVTSLWRVSDAVTTELMGEYYQRLSKGGSRIGSLEAAMAVVRKRHPHPYFWAPFIGIGRDAPLGGRSAESPEIAQEKPTKTEPAQQQPIDSSGARQEPQTTESASLQHPGRPGRPTEPLSDSNSRAPETSPDHRSLRAQVFLVGPPDIKLQAAIRLDDNKYTPKSETITCGPPCGLWIPRQYQLGILSGESARSKPFNLQDVAGPQITLHCKVKYRRNDIGTVAGLALGFGQGAFHIGLIAIGFSARDKNLFQNSFFPAGLALTVTGVGLTVTGGTLFGVNKTRFSVEQRQGSPVAQ